MTQPHWQTQHEWWIEDFTFELEQIYNYKLLLRKHPDDEWTLTLRGFLEAFKKRLNRLVLGYEKIYGDKPDLRLLRKRVEKDEIV